MRKMKQIVGLLVVLSLALAPTAFAAKREKFGADKRHEEVKKELRTIKPSTETFKWKMVMPWSKGLLFYDLAQHFADSVALASGGRLEIKLFSAGELVGAMESFDAVTKARPTSATTGRATGKARTRRLSPSRRSLSAWMPKVITSGCTSVAVWK